MEVRVERVVAGAAAVIVLAKLTQLLAPRAWYFTFGAFLYEYPEPLALAAVAIKFGIPLVVGVMMGLIISERPVLHAGVASCLAAVVLAWPAIVAWDLHAPEELADRRYAFLVVYLFYFASYTYIARFGARLGFLYAQEYRRRPSRGESRTLARDLVDWDRTMKPLLVAAISSALTLGLGKLFAQ